MDVVRFDAHLQQLLNTRPVRRHHVDAPHPGPIPVRARLVWEFDGDEWPDARAMAWTTRLVLVHLPMERRLQILGAWLDAADVQRITR